MGWKLGGGRELKKLQSHLHDDETVRFIAQGRYEDDQGIVVLTDLRLMFLFHGVMSQRKEDFPLRNISSVQTKSGMVTGDLTIFVSGNSAKISNIIKADLQLLADAVREGMARQTSQPPPGDSHSSGTPVAVPTNDPYEALTKLSQLHAAGLISDEEFAAKRQDILGRM